MGLPQVITSDQGREFNNSLNTKLMNLLGIKRILLKILYSIVVCILPITN